MGRPTTGKITINQADNLSLKHLTGSGALVKGKTVKGEIRFPSGIEGEFESADNYLSLRFSWGEQTIDLYSLPSNLGRGEVFYFVCPVTGKLCRTLYRAYGSQHFKHRDSYRIRLYYPLQLLGGRKRQNGRYWYYEEKVDSLYSGRNYLTFKGKPTKRAERIERTEQKLSQIDELRMYELFESLKYLGYGE